MTRLIGSLKRKTSSNETIILVNSINIIVPIKMSGINFYLNRPSDRKAQSKNQGKTRIASGLEPGRN